MFVGRPVTQKPATDSCQEKTTIVIWEWVLVGLPDNQVDSGKNKRTPV
jgi:hypothetical protein